MRARGKEGKGAAALMVDGMKGLGVGECDLA